MRLDAKESVRTTRREIRSCTDAGIVALEETGRGDGPTRKGTNLRNELRYQLTLELTDELSR